MRWRDGRGLICQLIAMTHISNHPTHRWPLIGAMLVIALSGGSVSSCRKHQPAAEASAAHAREAAAWKGALPAEVATRFTRARTQQERLQLVREPAEVSEIMAEFFTHGRGAREQVAEVKAMPAAGNGTDTFERFAVTMADGSTRLLCVVVSEAGAKVDFKSYARYGSVSWEALLTGQTRSASEVRVFLEKGNYYNYNFTDEKQRENFIATSPDLDVPVQLYILREAVGAKTLEELIMGKPMRVTLAIRATDDSHDKRQFEITRLVTAGWVAGSPNE